MLVHHLPPHQVKRERPSTPGSTKSDRAVVSSTVPRHTSTPRPNSVGPSQSNGTTTHSPPPPAVQPPHTTLVRQLPIGQRGFMYTYDFLLIIFHSSSIMEGGKLLQITIIITLFKRFVFAEVQCIIINFCTCLNKHCRPLPPPPPPPHHFPPKNVSDPAYHSFLEVYNAPIRAKQALVAGRCLPY